MVQRSTAESAFSKKVAISLPLLPEKAAPTGLHRAGTAASTADGRFFTKNIQFFYHLVLMKVVHLLLEYRTREIRQQNHIF